LPLVLLGDLRRCKLRSGVRHRIFLVKLASETHLMTTAWTNTSTRVIEANVALVTRVVLVTFCHGLVTRDLAKSSANECVADLKVKVVLSHYLCTCERDI